MSRNQRIHARPHASISTPDLVLRALEQQRAHGPGMDGEDLSYLVELHQRTDRATYEMAVRLAESADAQERILGLRVLRELGPWGNRTFRAEAVPLLRQTIERHKSDPETLYWALKALTWQGDYTVDDDLLGFVDNADDAVRQAGIATRSATRCWQRYSAVLQTGRARSALRLPTTSPTGLMSPEKISDARW